MQSKRAPGGNITAAAKTKRIRPDRYPVTESQLERLNHIRHRAGLPEITLPVAGNMLGAMDVDIRALLLERIGE